MLLHLAIRDFAVVKHLDLDLQKGMTTITGETGAGKSIALDALGLCMGDRAEASMVRKGAAKAEICATFDITKNPAAQKWIAEQDLGADDECMIRRVISSEGRSKAYVNGTPVALQQLKSLTQSLISIHGQHAHQQLLKPTIQRQLLDDYADNHNSLSKLAVLYGELQDARHRLDTLKQEAQQRLDRRNLLTYQVEELDEFALQEGEFEELEKEHKRLSNSQTLLEQAQRSFYQLYEADEGNALGAVQQSLDQLEELQEHDESLVPIVDMLREASIQITEASHELRDYCEQLDIDPMRMQQVESRYTKALELARKHQVKAEQLAALHKQLVDELTQLQGDEDAQEALEQHISELQSAYICQAKALSENRKQAGDKLSEAIQAQIRKLNMPDAVFSIDVCFAPELPASRTGQDNILFKVSANPGQPVETLDKVASGGELSRIGLAVQVLSKSKHSIPTMIFDEVDTGISGPTASVVGQLLRSLGACSQVICVTHLPQVAALGHQQMFVTKFSDGETTETNMMRLSESQRVEELARLLAGDTLTESALANARELLHQHMN
ncbi:DNA repair protein RecN [Aestuariibacter salexigens]|uniref:DNA repair protein RecN n=1 Tax=Aestuariibacter salexigens TaxID=226010 RepID=UPI0003F89E47|nr:DNA repair protein RecN [Aestuariibacter salexigens]